MSSTITSEKQAIRILMDAFGNIQQIGLPRQSQIKARIRIIRAIHYLQNREEYRESKHQLRTRKHPIRKAGIK